MWDLPRPGIKPVSPALAAELPTSGPPQKFAGLFYKVPDTLQLLGKHSVQFSSVAQSCLTLCDPMNHSKPGLPVHHQLPESTQTHVHWVGDAVQPSHPVVPFSHSQSFPASGSLQMSQLFTSGGQSTGVSASISVLPMNTEDWFPLGWTGVTSLAVKREFFPVRYWQKEADIGQRSTLCTLF